MKPIGRKNYGSIPHLHNSKLGEVDYYINEGQERILTLRYYLCSAAVIEHFPDLEKSKPFNSGYDYDEDIYYIVATDNYEKLFAYYDNVIAPFNEKSNVPDIAYWLRECTNSQVDEAPKGCITKCRSNGVFRAIENVWGLTNERNRAYCIYRMSEYYGLTPIEFVNRVVNYYPQKPQTKYKFLNKQ